MIGFTQRSYDRGIVAGIIGMALIAGTFAYTNPAQAATSPLGSVRIQVVVVGGTAHASQFQLKIKKNGPVDTGTISGSGTTVIFSSLTPGTYSVTSSGPSGYKGSWSGDCNSQGEVTIGIGTEAACTLTQTYGTSAGGGGGGGGAEEPETPSRRGGGRTERTGSNRSSR